MWQLAFDKKIIANIGMYYNLYFKHHLPNHFHLSDCPTLFRDNFYIIQG